MYPFPRLDLQAVLAGYPNLEDAVWVQEEPKNQGSWYAMQSRLSTVVQREKVDVYLRYVGREPSASAAAGYSALHLREQEAFIDGHWGQCPGDFKEDALSTVEIKAPTFLSQLQMVWSPRGISSPGGRCAG